MSEAKVKMILKNTIVASLFLFLGITLNSMEEKNVTPYLENSDSSSYDSAANNLIKLYQGNRFKEIINLFNQFDSVDKLHIALTVLGELIDTKDFDMQEPHLNDDGYQNIYKEDLTSLLAMLLQEYRDLKFYNHLFGAFNEEIVELSKDLDIDIQFSRGDHPGLLVGGINNKVQIAGVAPSPEKEAILRGALDGFCQRAMAYRYYICSKVQRLKNMIADKVSFLFNEKQFEQFSPSQQKDIVPNGHALLRLFADYTKEIDPIQQEDLKNKLTCFDESTLHKIIEHLANSQFICNEMITNFIELFEFAYNNDEQKINVQLGQLLTEFCRSHPIYTRLIYAKSLVAHLGSNQIKFISSIHDYICNMVSVEIIDLLKQDLNGQNMYRILEELNVYYKRFGLDFIDSIFDIIIDESIEMGDLVSKAILTNLNCLISEFIGIHKIDEIKFKYHFIKIQDEMAELIN